MSSIAELIRTRAETVCSCVKRGRELPPVEDPLAFAGYTGRLVAEAISYATHVAAIPPILLSCAMELHGCISDKKVIVRVPAWGTIGYNDRRIMKHPLIKKAKAWMESRDDGQDKNLELEPVSGDSFDWRAVIQGTVNDWEIVGNSGGREASRGLELRNDAETVQIQDGTWTAGHQGVAFQQGDGTTKRNLGAPPAEEHAALDTGGKRRRMNDHGASRVDAPVMGVGGALWGSAALPRSQSMVDIGRPSLKKVPLVEVVKIEQTEGVMDSLPDSCTPCKKRAVRCITICSTKTGKLLQSCRECTKKRKKCFYGDEPPAITRDRSRAVTGLKSRAPSRTATSPAAPVSLEPRRARAGAAVSRASSRRRSMTRAPVPPAERMPSCYVLLPNLRDVRQERIYKRIEKIEQGITAATAVLASLGRQHQALAQAVAALQESAPMKDAAVHGASSNSLARISLPPTLLPSADVLPPDGLPRGSSLPLCMALPETPLSELPISLAGSTPTDRLLPHDPETEDPSVILAHEIGNICHISPPKPAGQETAFVHGYDSAEAAMVDFEISQACEGLEVVADAGSKVLGPGSPQVKQNHITEDSQHVCETGAITSDAPDDLHPSSGST